MKIKRIIAVLLTLVMCLAVFPVGALGANAGLTVKATSNVFPTASETTVDFHANEFVLEQKKSGELFTVVSKVAGFDQGVYEAVFSSGNNHCATEISPKGDTPPVVSYDLWIGETQVTDANCADIPGVIGEGAKAEYDPDAGTLTLTNVKGVTGVAPRYVDDALIAFKGDLTIRLVGENSLVCDDDVIAIMAIDGSLTVEGEGSLKVDSDFIAVKVKKDLNLNGGTLDFSTNREISGMYTVLSAYGLIYSGGALSVDGGVLKAELDLWTDPILYSKTDAVKAYDISIAKGEIDVKVIASTAGKQAIVNALKALNNVTVTGGKVTVDAPLCENGIYASNRDYLQSGGTVASSAAEALFASNTFTISGGEITLTATGDDEYSCGLSTNKGIFFLNGTEKVSVTSENGVPVKGFRNGNGPITVDDKLFISVPEGGSTGQNKWGDPIFVDANGDPAKTVEILPFIEYNLWVGETRVTNANCRSIPGVTGDGAKAEYDPATQTLTFTGVTGVTGKHNGSGVYAEDISLTVKGNAVIDGDYNNGIYVTGSAVGSAGLTLDGELTFRGADVGINCDGDITVAGGYVKALPYSRLSYQKEMTGVIASGKVTVTGGTLEAKGNYNKEAIISDPGGEIIIPDTHYIRAPFGGSVKVTDNNGHPCAFIVNGEGKTASVVIIKPKVYYNITLDAGDHGAVTVPDKALAGEPISPTIEPDDDYVIALVSLAYGMVENVLYDKNHGDMLPVEFIMPDSDVTLKVGFSEKIYTGLASLTVSEGTLDPVFKTKILSYTDTVGCGVGEVEVSFDVTRGHQLRLDETQFKAGSLTYRYESANYPTIPTGATAVVELKAAETVLKIKTLPINGQLIPTEYAVTFSRSVHSLTHMPKVDPGCETAGTEEYWKCSVCNKLFSDKDGTNDIAAPAIIKALGHAFTVESTDAKFLKDGATCTTPAIYYKSCSRCGEASATDTFTYGQPNGHSFTVENTDAKFLKDGATCTTPAVYYKSCFVCGEASATDTFTSGTSMGHSYTAETVEAKYLKSEADCTNPAVYYKSCERCGLASTTDTFTSGTSMGHSYTMETVGTKYLKSPADCENAAVYYKSCERCGLASTTDTFTYGDPNGHSPLPAVEENRVEPTCSNEGSYDLVEYCSVCEEEVSREGKIIPVLSEDDCPSKLFTDVPPRGTVEHTAVDWAFAHGVTKGTSKTTFSPDRVTTRAQLVMFLWRANGSPEPTLTDMPFTDVPANAYYFKAVLWAAENGVTEGTGVDEFSPLKPCTRLESIEMIWRAYA